MGRVDGSSKEEEFSTYLLYELFAFLVKEECCRCWRSVLFLGAIFDGFCRKGGMLGFTWRLVSELFEGLGFVTRHGQVYFAVVVVPVQACANVAVTGPISAEGIIGFKHRF